MKVLTSPDGATLLTCTAFTSGADLDGMKFIGLDAKNYDNGVVAEVPDFAVKAQVASACKKPEWQWMEAKDFMRDIRFFVKASADVPVGTEAELDATGRGYRIKFPDAVKVNRAEGLAVGVSIAIGPAISPKAFMNARGKIVAVNGTKVTVEFDANDIDRINRSTGKTYKTTMNMPKTCVEVIA